MPRPPALPATIRGGLLLAALSLGACGSTSSSRQESAPVRTRALRVRFVDWRSGLELVLVDQSHTDRTQLYSTAKPLDQAGTKVTTDEVLEETVRFFREQGFFDRASPGAATTASGGAQALEVETPEGVVHMSVGPATPAGDAKVFSVCRVNFVALYNNVYQLQSVDRAPAWEDSKQPSKKLGLQPSGGAAP